jgi:hypothetical protein
VSATHFKACTTAPRGKTELARRPTSCRFRGRRSGHIRFSKFAGALGRNVGEAIQWSKPENLGLVKRLLSSYKVTALCIIVSAGLYATSDLTPSRVIGAPSLSKTAFF